MTGTLYVVATPIGNLEDITMRALRILGEVDYIAAEDTRHTRKLLNHYEIHANLLSCHRHNEAMRAAEITEKLSTGHNLALVSDAGTPGIADPGARVVEAVRAAGHTIVPIPGAAAVSSVVSVAGRLLGSEFHFAGFLPEKPGKRGKKMEALLAQEHGFVCYLARWDVTKYLIELAAIAGDRQALLARELTKQFEELQTGSLSELAAMASERTLKGELCLLVSGGGRA